MLWPASHAFTTFEQVALFAMSLVAVYAMMSVAMPAFLLYDDACHFLGRMLSLMGTDWRAAAIVCCGIAIDKFHFKNHISAFCIGKSRGAGVV